MKTTKDFLKEYDTGNLEFNSLQYRKGARVTCRFGMAEGYRRVDGKMIWDTVRIHSGVDRSYHGTNWLNVVISPFNFQRAEYIDYGKEHVYGSVLRLFQDEYEFEMRILHIYPKDLSVIMKELIKNKSAIPRNTVIGKAGAYGSASSGKHTHTEFISYHKSCKVFDDILETKFKDSPSTARYKDQDIIDFYHKQKFWVDERRSDVILKNFLDQTVKRKVENDTINKYSYIFFDWYFQALCTRYSSELLFNGL